MSQDTTTHTGLDGYAETTIQCAVSRLIAKFGFPEQDREDLEQDLRVIVLEGLRRNFDPAKAKRETFIVDCVEHRTYNLLRDRRRQRRDPRRLSRIGDDTDIPGAVSVEALTDPGAGSAQRRTELRLDVAQVTAGLTPRQQQICALLPTQPLTAIAERLGVHRQTVHRDLQRIRAVFAAAGMEGYRT